MILHTECALKRTPSPDLSPLSKGERGKPSHIFLVIPDLIRDPLAPCHPLGPDVRQDDGCECLRLSSPASCGGSMPVGWLTSHGMDSPDKPVNDTHRS